MRTDQFQNRETRPMTPRSVADAFVSKRESDSTEETVGSYRRRLDQFCTWCEQESCLLNLNDLRGRHLQEYWEWRRPDLGDTAMKNEFGTIKKFLEFGVAVEAVEPFMPDVAQQLKPTLSKSEEASSVRIETQRAERILSHLEKFEYATRNHVIMMLTWSTAARISGLRSVDVDDIRHDLDSIEFKHRPDQGTGLKNKTKSNRHNSLTDRELEILEDYTRVHRERKTDEYGREPLLTTNQGRISKSYLRMLVYRLTHPCIYTDCPHERDPDDCEALEHGHESLCPSAVSPHAVRTGAITRMRNEGAPIHMVAERVDATPETLRAHYDYSDDENRMQHRRDVFDQLNR